MTGTVCHHLPFTCQMPATVPHRRSHWLLASHPLDLSCPPQGRPPKPPPVTTPTSTSGLWQSRLQSACSFSWYKDLELKKDRKSDEPVTSFPTINPCSLPAHTLPTCTSSGHGRSRNSIHRHGFQEVPGDAQLVALLQACVGCAAMPPLPCGRLDLLLRQPL